MEAVIGLIIGIGVGAVGVFFFQKSKEAEKDSKLKQQEQNMGELTAQLAGEKARKDELIGKNKQMFAQLSKLEAANDELSKKTAKFEAEERKNKADLERQIDKLDTAKKNLETTEKRINKEDEERREMELKERDRIWAEHEDKVKLALNEICKRPEYGFETYDNNNLPEGFDGKLKPDFMIEFLGQYMIFDAKTTKSDNLQTYISTNIKSTAAKIKGNNKIYNTVFFVVPTEAIELLKTVSYYEQGYTFFIVSPESLGPIIASFKKIKEYEFAEKMDPEDRENIVRVMAEFDSHIRDRNAMDLLIAERGVNILNEANRLPSDIKDELETKKAQIGVTGINKSDVKTLATSERQQKKIEELVNPKAKISKAEVKSAADKLMKK
ncbi:MAG: hypothetical protein ACD_63C00038G0002 [uncultured bacterium]|nr:MAG: hypothetical protein ACD_63C00038G0002 [uncultured bacterium]